LLILEPVIDLVERVLGDDCHLIAQNALRQSAGMGVVNWHIDDSLFFPFLPEVTEIEGDARLVPCYSLNVMIVLSDVGEERFGPTQVVPGSHLSGREPPYRPELPDDAVPVSLPASAGDVYLINSQTWHRGAQIRSGRTRYLLAATYGRRFISQRFFPFVNYRMPPEVLDGASDRLLRLLGRHDKGPYG
jgi:ectoine hydroxylase-related dioxygenase (phytanoyl-CoA dioxygenase family)